MLDLDDQLSVLARRWEAGAPAISIEEATTRERAHHSVEIGPENIDDVDRLVLVSTVAGPPRRRRRAVAMIGVAALVLLGLVMLVRHGDNDQEPFRPGIDTVAPQPSVSATPSTSTPASSSSSSAPVTTVVAPIVVPTYADPTTQQLATIQSTAAATLTGVDTLQATSTWKSTTQTSDGQVLDDQVMVNTVTLSSNGSMWTTGTSLEWSSYDSTTGIGRTQAIGSDGGRIYTQYSFTTLPLPVVIGLDPTPRFAEMGGDAEINEAEQDGRPVWEVTSTHDSTGLDGAVTHIEETVEIDKATGLVIGRMNTSTNAGTVSVQSATLTNLEFNVAFPPEGFPGSFPSGANVQGVTGPNSFHLLTVDEAATEFGGGLVAPSPLPATARIYVDSVPNQQVVIIPNVPPGFTPPSAPRAITFDFPQGFAPSSVTVFRDADAGTTTSTTTAGGASVVTAGPFEGAPSELRLGVLTIDDGSLTIVIRAASDARALEVANSLVTIS